MKKLFVLLATVIVSAALLLAGCGNDQKAAGSAEKGKTITVGASPTPHAEILQIAKPLLEKEGITLKIVEFSDYVKPNLALKDKELDANFFQHVPYLDAFNKDHKLDLKFVEKVHVEPLGLYSSKVKNVKDLADGARIALPNDPSNEGRSLILLAKAGLITLKDPNNINATLQDIAANPHNYKFIELEAAQLPRSLDDVEAAIINTNYAIQAKLNPVKDALVLESKDSPYANGLVVRAGDENRPEIKALEKALNSPEVKKFIEEKYSGAIVPAF